MNAINHLAISVTSAAQKTLEVAVEAAEGGVTPTELPAIVAHAEQVKAAADRLISTSAASAARYRKVQELLEELAS